jgi:hypothetical protein
MCLELQQANRQHHISILVDKCRCTLMHMLVHSIVQFFFAV